MLPPLGPPPSGADLDAYLAACASIRGECRWHIAPSLTETVTLDGDGSGVAFLPSLLVTAVQSITVDGIALTEVDQLWSAAGIITGVYSTRMRGIVVTFTHGYAECPAELLTIAYGMAAAGATQRLAAQERSGAEQVTWSQAALAGATGIPEWHRSTIARYRIPLLL